MKILLTGATGYVGGKLLNRLLSQSSESDSIRCLVRDPATAEIADSACVEVFKGDTLEADSINGAMRGVDAAYYLIHAMNDDGDFEEQDRTSAQNFLAEAERSGVSRIVYLSGLANEPDDKLSSHLASRIEVGRILRGGKIPCIEFRAAMVVGDGSLSFRMLKHLCNRLPVMICPKWLSTPTQPIGIDDLLEFLKRAQSIDVNQSLVVEIGCKDNTTYLEMLKEYCRQARIRRLMIPVPILSTKFSSYWLTLVTPETAKVGRDLIDGLTNPTLVTNNVAAELFSDIEPVPVATAIERAIAGNPELLSNKDV